MKSIWTRHLLVVTGVAMMLGVVGCHEDDTDVGGILAIIYAVGDLVIGIIQAAT